MLSFFVVDTAMGTAQSDRQNPKVPCALTKPKSVLLQNPKVCSFGNGQGPCQFQRVRFQLALRFEPLLCGVQVRVRSLGCANSLVGRSLSCSACAVLRVHSSTSELPAQFQHVCSAPARSFALAVSPQAQPVSSSSAPWGHAVGWTQFSGRRARRTANPRPGGLTRGAPRYQRSNPVVGRSQHIPT